MKHLPEKKVRDWKQERKRRFYRFLFSLQCLTRQTGPVRQTSKLMYLSPLARRCNPPRYFFIRRPRRETTVSWLSGA